MQPQNTTQYPIDPNKTYAPWVYECGLYAPYGMCQCGCGQTALIAPQGDTKLGYVNGQPRRFIRGHNTYHDDPVPRFWEKVDKRTPVECWEWQGTRDKNGYGKLSCEGKCIRTHRFSYELHYGVIPDGLYVLHSCDNPSCVNPYHLFSDSNDANMADMVEKNRQAKGEGSGMSKLTQHAVIEIRKRYSLGEYQQSIADSFGVTQATISAIILRKTWAHV